MDTSCGRDRPAEGMNSPMICARNVTGPKARGALIASVVLAAAAPLAVRAQAPAPAAAPPPAAAPAAEAAQAPPPGAPPAPQPAAIMQRPLSESVAATVNDDIIST